MGNNDVFVLVLQLDQYKNTDILGKTICGRKITDWVKEAVSSFHYRFVETSIKNDIITIFRENITSAKYTVITYADMPLLTSNTLLQAINYCKDKNAYAVKLPRGWVFDSEHISRNDEFKIEEFQAADQIDYLVAFNDLQISKIRPILQERINESHIKNGVTIIDPAQTYIEANVKISDGCTIEPSVHIEGDSVIKKGATLLAGTRVSSSLIGENTVVGPYAHIRPGSSIGSLCKIGNFVEVKRSKIGDGTKAAHMTYIGDATIGKNCNIGCGVIFCNYDGKKKSNTIIGDNVFIGSNTCLVAPLEIGSKAFIAAGSVITDNLPNNALGIARARQAIKEHYITE